MNVRGGDWLDVLARRSVRGRAGGAREPEPPSTTSIDDGVSREGVLRLAVAGAASLSLAAWRVPGAEAGSDLGECLTGCKEDPGGHDDALKRQLHSCNTQTQAWKANATPAWDVVFRTSFYRTQALSDALQILCALRAWRSVERDYKKCRNQCYNDCAGSGLRSLQASRQACEPTPPPKKPYTPAPPPAPNMTADPCLACNQVGGMCCGPFKPNPDGSFQPCACANAAIGCERYGCG